MATKSGKKVSKNAGSKKPAAKKAGKPELPAQELEQIRKNLENMNLLIKPYQLAWVNFDEDCDLLEKNAHFMVKEQLEQLTNNVKTDGFLSQLPFAIKEEDGRFKIISGNHRVKAARKAEVKYGLLLYLDRAEVSRDKELAIQISHNEIKGQDDMGMLQELYMEIQSLDMKQYSAINEAEIMKYEPVSIMGISDQDIAMNEVKLLFTDAGLERMQEIIEKLNGMPLKENDMFGFTDFDRFIDAMTEVKRKANIKNTTVAFMKMLEICEEWIEVENQKIAESDTESAK